MKIWISIILLLSSMGVFANDWPGFRGATNNGWAQNQDGPTHWSSTQNITWKTAIPGSGHSSPIVFKDKVFVTTAYPSPHYETLRTGLRIATVALLGLTLLTGLILSASRLLCSKDPDFSKVSRILLAITHVGLLGIIVCLIALLPSRLGLEDNDERSWKVSILVSLSCFGLIFFCFPPRSRWWLFISIFSLLFGLAAWQAVPDKRTLQELSDFSSFMQFGLLLAPGLVGILGMFFHFWAKKRQNAALPPATMDRFIGPVACLTAIALGCTFFWHFNYVRRYKVMVRAVVCLGLADGKIQWVCEALPGTQKPVYNMNSPATPCPVTDGKFVYAYFGSPGMMCVSLEGKLQWSNRELPSEGRFGNATSPLLHDGMVFMVSDIHEPKPDDSQTNSFVVGLDAQTGKKVWEVTRKNHSTFASYNTPLIESSTGTNILWVSGWHGIEGYLPKSGKKIASIDRPYKGHHLVASSISEGSRLYSVDATAISCLDLGKLLAKDSPWVWTKPFKGEISSTPLMANGMLFVLAENGYATCLDAVSGQVYWEKRLKGRFFSSIIAAGKHVYFTSESGTTTVVSLAKEFRLIAENTWDEKVYASLVPVSQSLLLRSQQYLARVQ